MGKLGHSGVAPEKLRGRRAEAGTGAQFGPQNDQIYNLLGILESQRGNSAQAVADLRKAVELNPHNLRASYQLASEIERQGDANSESEFQELMQKILAAQPNNLAALLELSRIAAKRGDATTFKSAVAEIDAHSSSWPPEVQQPTCRSAGPLLPLPICMAPQLRRRFSATCSCVFLSIVKV